MIQSILDQDLYTFTVGQAILQRYPNAQVKYQFTSRRSVPINDLFKTTLVEKIKDLSGFRLKADEQCFLKDRCLFLNPSYISYISQYKFEATDVNIQWGDNLQNTNLSIVGPWHRTVFWEVPLLALISETYFETVDANWTHEGQKDKIQEKGNRLSKSDCSFADFGTRRRRSYESQDLVVQQLKNFSGFVGTSNVHFAMKYDTRPIGTMSHQWLMGISALESMRHANRYALNIWNDVYQGNLGIALSDTFGSEAFFEDFDGVLARLFDGIRHDSGCPFAFTDKVVAHYKKLRIPPIAKTIVFSDGLDIDLCLELQIYCAKAGILCSFGIGTHLTNDYENSPALNMVIKLRSLARALGMPFTQVVKLSDVFTKATGDADALRVARWIYFGIPLDAK